MIGEIVSPVRRRRFPENSEFNRELADFSADWRLF
jgi:hypothetical protein